MTKKRKRAKASQYDVEGSNKRAKTIASQKPLNHPTLHLYYAQVSSLRQYLLSKLPKSSKTRRRRIASSQGHFLDTTLVCNTTIQGDSIHSSRLKDFNSFSQRNSLTAGSSIGDCSTSQSELIDYAIWFLFHKVYPHAHRPPHMLCHGYQRARSPRRINEDHYVLAGIPGLSSYYPNSNVEKFKNALWTDTLSSLGKEGERVMLDLVLDCGVFEAVGGGQNSYCQLSGIPLTELPTLKCSEALTPAEGSKPQTGGRIQRPLPSTDPKVSPRKSTAITFVRNRMFYARPALNAKGRVTFGFRHIHVLNCYSDLSNSESTVHVMKYIFPRQFGLHNVFTSTVDSRETVQAFKDYTLREHEITQHERQLIQQRPNTNKHQPSKQHLPRRLRGKTYDLVKRLQINHARCSYHQLLKHYCLSKRLERPSKRVPSTQLEVTQLETQISAVQQSSDAVLIESLPPATPSKPSLFSMATPHSEVSAFCRAVLSNIIPDDFWGQGEHGQINKRVVLHNADQFVRLRRFEHLTLHAVSQGIKLNSILWLVPSHVNPSSKLAASDMQKRREILEEFLYYIFDSMLIPLVRSNFHVTESTAHQNRLFYFRHDVWRSMTEPAMSDLKISIFEEIKPLKARQMLDARALGFSQIRLLPKANGMRPITNLRRRGTKLQNGKVTLGRSINSIMAPVFNVLEYEKRKRPALVGCGLFSVGDMYPKLKSHAQMLQKSQAAGRPLYFAKTDAKSCFDTIPQRRVVGLMKKIAAEEEYRIGRHAEIKSSETRTYRGAVTRTNPKPARKFVSIARASTEFPSFDEVVGAESSKSKKNTIFVDSIVQTAQSRRKMLDLLEDHVEKNVIKIGKRFFRQKAGIPQGSVLSSLLCNYFYAELESECLDFLEKDESILLRLIDDFLLITTNKDHARRFLQIMHDGVEQYGVEINPAKSLTNFEAVLNGHQVPQLQQGTRFPYCGNMIDMKNLEITKDRDRRKGTVLADTLTVDPFNVPGQTFYRKALSAFKIQTHKMFLDTTFNSPLTVLATIYQNFLEAAMKYYRYAKCMASSRQPHFKLLIGTISDLVDLASVLIKGKHKDQIAQGYSCAISKCQVQWLAAMAFRNVLGKKQSRYREVIAWLDIALENSGPSNRKEAARLHRIAKQGEDVFRGYKF